MVIGIYSKENGVGKTTSANILKNELGFEVKSFSSKVSEIYELLSGINFSKLDRKAKEAERDNFIKFAEDCKKTFGENVWVKQLFKAYLSHDNIIIDDCRFNVELDALKKEKALIIGIYKNELIEDDRCDYIIHNNSSIEELIFKLKRIIILEGLKNVRN